MAFEDIYKSLLDDENNFFNSRDFGDSFQGADEGEDFLTSKEIVKMKEHPETNPGIQLPPGPVEIEETFGYFKRYNTRREHKYTETEMKEIRESCVNTIVHDYSEHDEYHMSDEERARNDSLQELNLKLGSLKRIYRKVDQYIEAMRVVVEAWELLEKKENYLHSSDEFFRLVSCGKIYHNRIPMPKLKGMDKYNIDMIIKYISNPELDPKDLVPIKEEKRDPWYDQFLSEEDGDYETEEEMMERLLSPEEVDYILHNADNPPAFRVKDIKGKYIKGYDVRSFGRSNKKKMKKKERYIADGLHDILNKIQSNPNNRGYNNERSYLVTSSLFEPPKKENNIWDEMRFEGSWADDDAVFLYDIAVREELMKELTPGNSYVTYADRELQKFFKTLEENGVNVIELRRKMNMSDEKVQAAETKKQKKENRKIESAILQRISKLNESPKFKKMAAKAEAAINEQIKEY